MVSLQNPSSFGALAYAEGITLPKSTYREDTKQNRLAIYFVIDEKGEIEVEGNSLSTAQATEKLKEIRSYQPNGFPLLIVDKDTPMEFVTPLIQRIQEAGFAEIKFSTSNETIN